MLKSKFLKGLLATAIVASSVALAPLENANAVENPTSFSDISGHWAESQIKAAVAEGYVSGYQDGTFKPNAEVTRAEFLKMLVAAMKLETSTASGSWFQPYVDAAMKVGYYADDFASWDNPITRKEMSTLAVRAALTGYKKDYDANRNLYEAARAGLIQGVGSGEIAPDYTTNRASAIVVIERILDIKAGKTLTTDNYATSQAELLWHRTNIQTVLPRYFSSPLYGNIDTTLLTSKSPNGNVSCTVSSIVVVNLDDPKDPNLKLIKSYDLSWLGGNKYYKVADSGGYAIIAFSDITAKDTLPNEVFPCKISVHNDDWYNTPQGVSSPKNPNRSYGLLQWDPEFGQPKFRVKKTDLKNNKSTFISGAIIPKGNFVSSNDFVLQYITMSTGSDNDVFSILTSSLNTKYNQ